MKIVKNWAGLLGVVLIGLAATSGKADDLQGQDSVNTNGTPSGVWTSGNLQNWRELQYIPCREALGNGPISNKVFTVNFPHSSGGTPGLENLTSWVPSSNVIIVDGPTLTQAGESWTYTVKVHITNSQPGFVNFFARMRAGAHNFPGSSLKLDGPPLQIHKPAAGPGSPNLAVKKVGPAFAKAGEIITYTLYYSNLVSAATGATGIQMTDVLPSALTYVPGSGTGGAVAFGDNIVWDLPNLAVGANGSVTFQAKVSTNAITGSTFQNYVEILSSEDDANTGDNTSTFTTTVSANTPPVANPDSYTTPANTLLTVAAAGVLTNDTDIDADPLTAQLVAGVAHGTLNFNANGSFTYQPTAAYAGSDFFTYRASDGKTNSATTTVTITVAGSPVVVVTPPVNQTNCPSTTAQFNVGATGTALTYQWYFGASALTGQTNTVLSISNVNFPNAGTYRVVVSGAVGSPVTNAATLVVNTNVLVTTPPTGQTNCVGSLTVFNVGATGTDLSYRWTFNGALVGTNSILNLGNVTATNAGSYTVTVSGACGNSVTNTAVLAVNEPVVVTVAPTSQTNVVGSNVVFSVGATGSNLTYQWLYNGTLIGTNSTLSLGAVTTNNAGTYCSIVSGACGNPITNCSTLTVNVPIVVVTPPVNQTNCPGTSAQFNVTATGTSIAYQWYFGTAILSGQTNSGLFLGNINSSNAGTYNVVITGAVGGPITNSATLTVNTNVVVTTPPISQTNCVGSIAQFSVSAIGTSLSYQWYFGANVLLGQTNSFLSLSNLTSTTAGDYHVIVSGACGSSVTNSANLTINQPVVVTNAPSNQISYTGSNVVFTVGATGSDLSYQWTYNNQIVGTNSTLNLNNLTTNSAGTYCSIVSGACGSPVTNCTTLTVQNLAPIANNDSYNVNEGGTLSVTALLGVLANDTDAEGNVLSAILVNGPANGTLTLNTNGSFSYVHNGSETTNDSFSYRAFDGLTNSGVATVTITVGAVNDAPVANNDSYTLPADSASNVPALSGVLANDSDAEGNPLTSIIVSNALNGLVTLNANGSFSYQPNTNYSGQDTFTYLANDGFTNSSVATVTLSIVPNAIVVITPPVNQTNCPGSTTGFNVVASGTALTYQWQHETITLISQTNSSLVLSNITAQDAGTYYVIISGPSGGPVTNSAFLAVNEAVVVTTPPSSQAVCLNSTATFNLGASGTSLSYQWYFGAEAITGQTNNLLSLGPVALQQAGEYSVVVSGACGVAVTNVVTLTVNEPVAITSIPTSQISYTGSNVVFSTGATGTGLSYQWIFNNAVIGTNSTLALSNVTSNNAGTYCSIVSGVCGGAITNCTTLTIGNIAPVAAADAYSVNEDNTLVVTAPGVLSNDNDSDGVALSAILVNTTTNGTLVLNSNGSFSYLPNVNFNGVDSFSYQANDGSSNSAVVTVSLTIGPVNDAPQFTVGANQAGNPGAGTRTIANWATGMSAGPLDEQGQTLSFEVSNNNAGLFSQQPTVSAGGTLSYAPGAVGGTALVTVILHDNGGTANGGVDTSASQTFSITVNGAPSVSITSPTNNATFVANQNVTIVADAMDLDGSVTNVQFFAGTNQLAQTTNAPYFTVWTNVSAGTYQLTARATDNLGLSTTSSVVTIVVIEKLPLTLIGPITYDAQVNLFKQTVRVFNPTPFALEAARVLVFNLPVGAKVFNANGTNGGVPFVQFNSPVPPGGSADQTIEYFFPARVVPVPGPILVTEIVPTFVPVNLAGTPQAVTRSLLRTVDKTFLLEFKTLLNRVYAIQYSSDLVTWKTVVPTITGNGSQVQWIDNGAPKTESHPSVSGKRFYRIILLP